MNEWLAKTEIMRGSQAGDGSNRPRPSSVRGTASDAQLQIASARTAGVHRRDIGGYFLDIRGGGAEFRSNPRAGLCSNLGVGLYQEVSYPHGSLKA